MSDGTAQSGTLRSGRAWVVLLTTIAVCLVADLWSKSLAFERIAPNPVPIAREAVLAAEHPGVIAALVPPHEPVTIIPKVLEFTLVLNPGAVFGIGPGKRLFFIGFTGVALGFGVWMFARWTTARDDLAHSAIGMLIAGGLGNLYDRLVFGCVRDFIHPLPGLKWPGGWKPLGSTGEVWPYVSNVADLVLLIGIGVLLFVLWRRDRLAIADEGRVDGGGGSASGGGLRVEG